MCKFIKRPFFKPKETPKNPYNLVWYDSKMSKNQIKKNNTKYWEWEIKYNNFKP